MAKQYDNNNRGTLGKNHRKEKDTHPEYAGKCEIDGKGYWISAWIKEGQGEKFFSLSFRPKDEAPSREPAKPLAPADDTDIPF